MTAVRPGLTVMTVLAPSPLVHQTGQHNATSTATTTDAMIARVFHRCFLDMIVFSPVIPVPGLPHSRGDEILEASNHR